MQNQYTSTNVTTGYRAQQSWF